MCEKTHSSAVLLSRAGLYRESTYTTITFLRWVHARRTERSWWVLLMLTGRRLLAIRLQYLVSRAPK